MTDERPLLICFDASEDSRRAIAESAALMPGRRPAWRPPGSRSPG